MLHHNNTDHSSHHTDTACSHNVDLIEHPLISLKTEAHSTLSGEHQYVSVPTGFLIKQTTFHAASYANLKIHSKLFHGSHIHFSITIKYFACSDRQTDRVVTSLPQNPRGVATIPMRTSRSWSAANMLPLHGAWVIEAKDCVNCNAFLKKSSVDELGQS